jgi:hypothetical protein
MASIVTYHKGGFLPAAPQKNRAELWDSAAGTYTSWDTAGLVTASRALTVGELAALTAQAPPPQTNVSGGQAAIANVSTGTLTLLSDVITATNSLRATLNTLLGELRNAGMLLP